ncbi:MAG TPA: DUF6569 family protein [Gemmataceae bacterium]|nr:DUF6569 family protein [Gemmataceae bacterium]
MRAQTIGLVLASVVTTAFLATVGLVVAWPYLTAERAPRQQQFVGFGNNQVIINNDVVIEPEMPIDQPIPAPQALEVRGEAVPSKDYVVSKAHTHGNLTVFLIHGRDTMKETKLVTLQEALAANTAIVHETGGGQLRIDNRGTQPLFIQAGDIVKGGTQDRVLPFDMLISANTNNTPIPALCVEQGRSRPRGNENSASFSSSSEQLPTRTLKLAAHRNVQRDVWANVRQLQTNLTRNVGESVQAAQSQTSLQLTLEHPGVQNAIQDHMLALAPITQDKDDAIGYVVAINGKIHSADVYASNALFLKLWPKLIRAGAVEAVAERQGGVQAVAPNSDAVQAFLASAEQGQSFRANGARTMTIRLESQQQVLFDTCDPNQNNLVLHRTVLAR